MIKMLKSIQQSNHELSVLRPKHIQILYKELQENKSYCFTSTFQLETAVNYMYSYDFAKM